MERLNQRQGFLVSAIVHLLILSILGSRVSVPAPPKTSTDEPPSRLAQEPKVFLPSREVLRQLAPRQPKPPAPRPAPTPPPPAAKDRMSVGGPTSERAKGPLILRKEDDLTKVVKGTPSPAPAPPSPPAAATAESRGGAIERQGAEGLRLPPGLGAAPRGSDGSRGRPGPPGPSIASSLRNLDQRLEAQGPRGLPTGTVQQMGPLAFDPQGADFTQWVNHFKTEIYRNWIPPEWALLGFTGHCDFEFTVERDGSLSAGAVKLLKSAGPQRAALDRSAQNALLGSRLLPLPADYAPPRLTITVSFYYGPGPQGS